MFLPGISLRGKQLHDCLSLSECLCVSLSLSRSVLWCLSPTLFIETGFACTRALKDFGNFEVPVLRSFAAKVAVVLGAADGTGELRSERTASLRLELASRSVV